MFTTILWATDGSETASRALPYAAELASKRNGSLVVAHVREVFVGRAGGYPVLADDEELQAHIRHQAAELNRTGLDATYVVRTCITGHTAATIAEIARDVHADLVVVGTHGYGRIAGLLLGSVTQALLHEAPCPVLAVPTGSETSELAAERELETARS